jgi:signal transduction histidine kinase
MVILFIITTLYFNRLIYRSIWSDFFYSLEKVSHFQLSDPTGLNLPRSEIEEFSKLNAVLEKMSRKLSDDYYTLKDFTANVSHEIQTPLAIIKSKVELLFQSEQMNEKDMMLIQNVYQSINRLSRIVNTLGILAKIENQQYIEKKRVDFFGKINYHLSNLNDLYESRQIRTSVDKNSDLCISINPYLADVMIINLLKNAFIHNHERGQIRVVIDKNRLIFLNTGPALAKPGKDIFNRFVRGDQQKESLGLGLALVKEICQLNNISINYRYINKIHTMELNFFKQKF